MSVSFDIPCIDVLSYDPSNFVNISFCQKSCQLFNLFDTRDVFYVRREVDLMKRAKVNAHIMRIFGKIQSF